MLFEANANNVNSRSSKNREANTFVVMVTRAFFFGLFAVLRSSLRCSHEMEFGRSPKATSALIENIRDVGLDFSGHSLYPAREYQLTIQGAEATSLVINVSHIKAAERMDSEY